MSDYDSQLRLEQMQKFNDSLLDTSTPWEPHTSKRRNWFRHFTIEDVRPYPACETQSYSIGWMKTRTVSKSSPTSQAYNPPFEKEPYEARSDAYANAPWRRLM